MTASKISQIAALMKASELMETQNKPQGADVSFGALLSQAPGGGEPGLSSGQGLTDTVKPSTASHAAYEKGLAQLGYRDNAIAQEQQPTARKELPEDAPEKLNSFEKKTVEAVAEELGVTVEEVAEQMEAMGLTVLDLMDPSKLAELALELTGGQDAGELLLSEGFQQLLGEIGELSQEFLAELGLTPQEMPQVMEQLEAMLSQGEAIPTETETEAVQPEQAAEAEAILSGNTEVLQAAAPQAKPGETAQPVQEENASVSVQQEVSEAEQPQEGQQESSSTAEDTEDGSALQKEFSSEPGKTQQGQVTYQATAQAAASGQAVEAAQPMPQPRVDVESIMRQISQMTRIAVSQAETSIEMQLNPENLGKVYLQVVSRQGAITAQLAAQDEAVKQALESQLAVLKDNMNQQGLKVEAVEVTIASHEFERNLEENQKNPSQEQQEAETERASRRNIRMDSLDELEGLMSEEESLVAKMMSEQGNRMDLTA